MINIMENKTIRPKIQIKIFQWAAISKQWQFKPMKKKESLLFDLFKVLDKIEVDSYYLKRPIFLHGCAKCSEIPSISYKCHIWNKIKTGYQIGRCSWLLVYIFMKVIFLNNSLNFMKKSKIYYIITLLSIIIHIFKCYNYIKKQYYT